MCKSSCNFLRLESALSWVRVLTYLARVVMEMLCTPADSQPVGFSCSAPNLCVPSCRAALDKGFCCSHLEFIDEAAVIFAQRVSDVLTFLWFFVISMHN